ncbi:general substrate transporter [Kockiozyma suomiensis]|uniref:general substrate transporter n=1 Tax=Kockiozyma suomiensis TaxID=1337062 RepID=UPI003344184E
MYIRPDDLSRFDGLVLEDVIPKHDKVWYKYPNLLKLNKLLLAAILTNMTNGFDGSMLNGLQSVPAWTNYFDHPSGTRLAWMGNAMVLGGVLISPVTPYICDKYGRRKPIFWGCAIIVLGSLFQGLAVSYRMFVLARALIGLGLSLASIAAPLLLVECAYPPQRGQMTSVLEPAWPVGSFFAAITTYLTFKMHDTNWSWRIPSLFQGLFPLIQCILVTYAPESPRWLVSQKRYDEAFSFLVEYHGNGDPDSDLVQFEMAEIAAAIEAEIAAKQSRWSQFFSTSGMKHRFFIVSVISIMAQFSGNGVLSYYLAIVLTNMGITDPNSQLLINLGSTIFTIFTAFTIALQIERIGRRTAFIIGFSTMFLDYMLWTFLSAVNEKLGFQNQGLVRLTVIVMIAYNFFYHFVGPFVPTYVVEVVPFSLRSKTTMYSQLIQAFTLGVSNFINPVGLERWGWRFYSVSIVALALWTILAYTYFPETGGKGLEEIAEIFDGEEALGVYHGHRIELADDEEDNLIRRA